MPDQADATAPPIEDAGSRRMYLVLAIFLIGLIGFLGYLWHNSGHGGVDENGYLVAGRLLAETHSPLLAPRIGPDGRVPAFVGDMWILTGTTRNGSEVYCTKYPPGVPTIMAAACLVGGPEYRVAATYMVNPLGYCIGLLAVYLLVRKVAGSISGIAAIIAVASSGVILRMYNVPGSHGISFALMTWSVFLLAGWMREGGIGKAIGAGFLCGAGAVARSGEIVMLLPLLVAAVVNLLANRPLRSRALPGSSAPPVGWVSAYFVRGSSRIALLESFALIGSWAICLGGGMILQLLQTGRWTGYSATGEHAGFGLDYIGKHWPLVLECMSLRGIGLLLPLGATGLVLMLRRDWRMGTVLIVWCAANMLLYASYYWAPLSDYNVYGRFFLPSYAPLAAGAFALLADWTSRARGALGQRLAAAGIVSQALGSAVLTIAWALPFARYELATQINFEQRLAWLAERVPADAVLLCDEMDMLNCLQFSSDYWLYDSRLFKPADIEDLTETGRLNSLDPARQRLLRERFLALGADGLRNLRDQVIAGHLDAGRRVFVFYGPVNHWDSFGSLTALNLEAASNETHHVQEPQLPRIPTRWGLMEIRRRTASQ